MLADLCKGITHRLVQQGTIAEDECEVYTYGLQMGAEIFFNLLSTIVIGLCCGMIPESLVFLIGYISIRSYSGGYHAETSTMCYMQSCAVVVGVLLFSKFFHEQYYMETIFVFAAVAVAGILCWAPIPATHKPLDEEETVHYRKKCRVRTALECVVIAILVVAGQQQLALVLSTGLFVIALLLLVGKVKNSLEKR